MNAGYGEEVGTHAEQSVRLHGLWLAIIMLTSLFGAAISVVTFWLVTHDAAAMLTAAGATFVGVTSLGIAMRKFLSGADPS